jgi:GAF domain-containing protein
MAPRYTRLPADFLDRLRDLLCTVQSAQRLLRPRSDDERLTRIVRLAVAQTRAELGVLLLVDEDRGDLRIAAACGEPVEPLVGQFIAPSGVAAFAIEDGSAIAVADAPPRVPVSGEATRGAGGRSGTDATTPRGAGGRSGTDATTPRGAGGTTHTIDDLGERAQIATRSVLAVPLSIYDRVTGALELRNAPAATGFGVADKDLCEDLAYLAAAAVEEFRGDRHLLALFASALPRALDPDDDGAHALAGELNRWLAELRQTAAWRRQVGLTARIRALCDAGEDAVTLAETVLDAILSRERRRVAPLPNLP